MDIYLQAAILVVSWEVLVAVGLGAVFGLFVGATPGLSATMAAALLVPLTFPLSPVAAIGAIVACTAMSIFAGDIPAAILRILGTPASAAYMSMLMSDGDLSAFFTRPIAGVLGVLTLTVWLLPAAISLWRLPGTGGQVRPRASRARHLINWFSRKGHGQWHASRISHASNSEKARFPVFASSSMSWASSAP